MVGLPPLAPSIQYSCRPAAAQYTLIQSSLGVIYMLHRSQKFILNVSRHTMFIIFQFVQPHPNLMKVEIFCEITHSNMGNGLARLPATLLIGWDRPSFYLISNTANHKASMWVVWNLFYSIIVLCCAVRSRWMSPNKRGIQTHTRAKQKWHMVTVVISDKEEVREILGVTRKKAWSTTLLQIQK